MSVEPPDGPPPPPPEGRLRPMGAAALVVWGLIGLVAGWLFHSLLDRGTGVPPTVSWAQPLTLLLVAAILWATAWSTRRTVQQRTSRLSPHQFVNRLALARACAYVGALVAGFYFGYAVSWIGVETSDLAGRADLPLGLCGRCGHPGRGRRGAPRTRVSRPSGRRPALA